MCLCPIKIRNPKLKAGTFLQGVDSEHLIVPCGHCPECNLKRVKDLTFRMYMEYLNCKQLGGFSLFQTLTYSNNHVPESNGMHFFCKKDLQKFFKRLRKHLEKYSDVRFTYVATMEYGGSNTHRPHYHLVFNVYGNIDILTFDELISKSWCYLDKKVGSEPIGRVDEKLVYLRKINSIYAIQYICKYIYKGTSVRDALLEHPYSHLTYWFREQLLSYGKSLENVEDYELVSLWSYYCYLNPAFKDYQLFPTYLQSKGIGLGWLETGCYEDLFDVVLIDSNGPLGYTKFHIPNFYIRKVFYDYDKIQKRYILNNFGIEYKKDVHNKMFHDFIKDDLPSINANIADLLGNRTMEDFAYYCVYLKGKTIAPKYLFLLEGDYLSRNLKDFIDLYEDESLTSLVADDVDWSWRHDYMSPPQNLHSLTPLPMKKYVGYSILFDDLPFFKGFNELYDYLKSYRLKFNKAHCAQIKEDIEKFKEAKLVKSTTSSIHPLIY